MVRYDIYVGFLLVHALREWVAHGGCFAFDPMVKTWLRKMHEGQGCITDARVTGNYMGQQIMQEVLYAKLKSVSDTMGAFGSNIKIEIIIGIKCLIIIIDF